MQILLKVFASNFVFNKKIFSSFVEKKKKKWFLAIWVLYIPTLPGHPERRIFCKDLRSRGSAAGKWVRVVLIHVFLSIYKVTPLKPGTFLYKIITFFIPRGRKNLSFDVKKDLVSRFIFKIIYLLPWRVFVVDVLAWLLNYLRISTIYLFMYCW